MRVHVNVLSSAIVHHSAVAERARIELSRVVWSPLGWKLHKSDLHGGCPMSLSTQHIYRSANGDRWLLMTDTASGRKFVRHEANQSSGGRITDTDVKDFLDIGGSGPEFSALRNLIGQTSEGST